jgi:hypothetical protein
MSGTSGSLLSRLRSKVAALVGASGEGEGAARRPVRRLGRVATSRRGQAPTSGQEAPTGPHATKVRGSLVS